MQGEYDLVHIVGIGALISVLTAQLFKPLVYFIQHREFKFLRVLDTGGMPSSHTALVTTLTVGVGVYQGVNSTLFGITLIFSLYFIFEATGLRQEVGKQAKVLNEIIDKVSKTHHLDANELRELIGHTWAEVLGGFALGLLVALILFF
ncbi:MAG: divergent PAP2 family protein [Candidatus Latescibacteria bacterium]|nr:divergent PAP2 family protein [bacterium]MBD3423863.1 divergent PAP2 family protein [Candidatus Latescibacterota bacterium]